MAATRCLVLALAVLTVRAFREADDSPRSVQSLIQDLLPSQPPYKMKDAMDELAKRPGAVEEAAYPITMLLAANNQEVSGKAFQTLQQAKISPPSNAIKAIGRKFYSKYTYERNDVMRALTKFKNPQPAAEEIVRGLADGDKEIESNARSLLSKIEAPESAVRYLAKGLYDEHLFVRIQCAKALDVLGKAARPALPEITFALMDPDDKVSDAAKRSIEVLQGSDASSVARIARELSTNKAGYIRLRAITSLALLGEAARPHLHEITSSLVDGDEKVRMEAQYLIKKLGSVADSAIKGKIAKDLYSDASWVRLRAIQALSFLKKDSRPALQEITRALADSDESVRTEAKYLITKVHQDIDKQELRRITKLLISNSFYQKVIGAKVLLGLPSQWIAGLTMKELNGKDASVAEYSLEIVRTYPNY